jgi:putative tryptophan/tyrosine transport system substrate-binding protein
MLDLRRRQFITLLGGAVVAWPVAARAQQQPVRPLIGVLSPLSAASAARNIAGLRSGLRDLGYLEGRNVTLALRYGDGAPDRMVPLAQDLVGLKPDVLMAGSMSGALAAQATTQTVPTVVIMPDDPVALGFAQSIARPGGNITGTWFNYVRARRQAAGISQAGGARYRARWGGRRPGRSNRRRHDPATAAGNSCLRYDVRAV